MKTVFYFGAAYIGVQLPKAADTNQTNLWDVPKDPAGQKLVGGHAVPVVSYNTQGPVCITWGRYRQMTWDFYDKYCEEAYACLSQDIVGSENKSPEGFDLTQLQIDLKEVTA